MQNRMVPHPPAGKTGNPAALLTQAAEPLLCLLLPFRPDLNDFPPREVQVGKANSPSATDGCDQSAEPVEHHVGYREVKKVLFDCKASTPPADRAPVRLEHKPLMRPQSSTARTTLVRHR